MDNVTILDSVLGFDLKADIRNKNGDLIKPGVKVSVMPDESPSNLNLRILIGISLLISMRIYLEK